MRRLLCAIALLCGLAHATNYYVATSANGGSDSNPCSLTSKCLTINHAGSLTAAGDVVHVGPGTFAGSVTIPHPGTAGSCNASSTASCITYVCDTQWSCRIPPVVTLNQSYVVIQNFEIDGTLSGVVCCGIDGSGATGDQIIGNKIHDTSSDGNETGNCVICLDAGAVGGGHHIYNGNFLYHNNGGYNGVTTPNNSGQHGIYTELSGDTVINNVVVDQGGGWCIHSFHNVDNWVVANNTLANCQNGGIVVGGGGSTQNNTTIINNYVANSGSASTGNGGINFRQCGTNMVGQNNGGFGNTPSFYVGTCAGITQGGTQVGSTADFVNYNGSNPDTANFNLTATSVAIGTGTTTCAPGHTGCVPSFAFDGTARTGTPTLGAYAAPSGGGGGGGGGPGTNYYVNANTGSDSNTATQAQNPATPWLTINHAIASYALSSTGATINVAPGTYSNATGSACFSSVACFNRGGSAPNVRLKVTCSTPLQCFLTTTVYFDGASVNDVDFTGFDVGNLPNATNALTTANNGTATTYNSIHIYGNYFHDVGQNVTFNGILGCIDDGMVVVGHPHGQSFLNTDIQIVGNRLNNYGLIGNACNNAQGIYTSSGGAIVQNNIVSNIATTGIQIYDQPCQTIVTNNTLFHNGRGISLAGGLCSNGLNTINNNIIDDSVSNAGNSSLGIGILIAPNGSTCPAGTTLISNNIFSGNASNISGSGACETILNSLSELPATTFVNYNTNGLGNYHLKTGTIAGSNGTSACVAGGTSPCVPPFDFDNVARPPSGAQSNGAYVLVSSGVPIVNFNPSPLAYGSVQVSSSATLTTTLANTGSSNLLFSPASISGTNGPDFTIMSTTCVSPLAPGATCIYTIKFTPSTTGPRSASLTLTDNASGSPHQVPLNGSGGAPAITLTPPSLVFGTTAPGSCSAPLTGTITSSGSANLIIQGAFTFDNPVFSFAAGGSCTVGQSLASGQSCTAVVKFCPTTSGAASGNLSIPTNAVPSPTLYPLSGNGGSSTATLTPTTFNFGNQQAGTSSPTQNFTFTNTGTLGLTGIAVSITGSSTAYAQTNNCGTTLASGLSCTIGVVFKPLVAGPLNASLVVSSSATGSPATSALSGTGTQASIVLNPSSSNFGQVLVGGTASLPVTITNSGTAPATISGISAAAPFSETNNCPAILNPTLSCTATVTFTPTVTGLVNGQLVVADNAPGNPHIAALGGTGTAPAVGFVPTSNAYGNQAVGTSSAPFSFTFSNTGTGPVQLLSAGLTGTNPGDFSIGTNTCTTTTPLLSDTFAGPSLDTTKWAIDTGPSPAPGPGNTGSFSAANVTLAQGQLELILTQVAGSPIVSTGAEVRSLGTFSYGTYLATMRASSTSTTPAGAGTERSGSVSSAFSFINNSQTEIDSPEFEGQGAPPGGVLGCTAGQVCAEFTNYNGISNKTFSGGTFVSTGDSAQHSYQWTWLPNAITFSVDGSLKYTSTTNIPSAAAAVLFNHYGTNSAGFGGLATTGVTRHQYVSGFSFIPATALAAGQSCTIAVVFKPTTSGARSATLSMTDSASGSPHTAAVSGTGIVTAPAVSLSTTSVNFGNQPVGSTSGSSPIVVTNSGTANLVISGITPTGDFIETDNCTTVTPGGTCTINGKFAPTVAGARTGNFSIASNAASSPDLVALQGFGTQAGATLTPSSLSFGTVVVGQPSSPQSLTLTNVGNVTLIVNTPTITGTNASDFSFSGSCGPNLAVNASCIYPVTATPGGAGSRTGTFNQTFGNGVSANTASLSVTGQATAPAVTLSPTSINFGSVTVGTAAPVQVIQLTNSGTANLIVTTVTPTGTNPTDVGISQDHCTGATVIPGQNCTVSVSMTPGAVGTRTANAHFITNAASSPNDVPLTVIGLTAPAPQATFNPTSLNFGNVKTGQTSAAQTVTVGNIGNANLIVSSVSFGGANPTQYSQTNNCATVAPNTNCAVTVNFTPTTQGSKPATLVIVSNDPTNPSESITLSGSGKGHPKSVVAVSSVNFGNQTVGTTSGPAVFTITNVGTDTLNVSSITTIGDTFPQTNTCTCCPVAVGASCAVSVQFSPQVLCGQFDSGQNCISNEHLGQVNIVSDADNSPQAVALQGLALPIPPPPGPITVTMGGVLKVGGKLVVGVQ